MMTLSKPTLETLIDLVEIKLSCMDVWDREDRREVFNLQRCLKELRGVSGEGRGDGAVIALASETRRRRGRPPKMQIAN
ncbi:hypothetical protein [Inquilinus sp. CAU 1745]|uniref:hypothetical protein n=1 Tax=Inquilinus sp. CAU 1745 TaxID=3140369 RepID=UPI00325B0E6C